MKRFVVVQDVLTDVDGRLIILSDYDYWVRHEDELRTWCKENNATFAGMTVALTDRSLTAFLLKWQ